MFFPGAHAAAVLSNVSRTGVEEMIPALFEDVPAIVSRVLPRRYTEKMGDIEALSGIRYRR